MLNCPKCGFSIDSYQKEQRESVFTENKVCPKCGYRFDESFSTGQPNESNDQPLKRDTLLD